MLESQQKPENKDLNLPSFSDDDDDDTDLLDEKSRPGRKSRRRGWIIGISAVLLVIILVGSVPFIIRSLRPPRVVYQFQQVTQGNLSLTVTATGPVQGTTYNADFLATGKVAEIDVKVGQQVKAGQVLAKLDTTALQDAVNTAQATLQQQKDFGTQDAINVAQDQLTTAQHNLDNATLTAPHAGTVTAINGVVGGLATAPNNSGFIQIVDMSALQVQANVNESDIGGVALGQTVQFTVSAYGNKTFDGTVSAISPLGQTVSNVVTYPVIVNVDMNSLQGANVLPGMTASVTITTATRSGVLLIPVNAVNFAQSSTLITSSSKNAALGQAQQMLSDLKNGSTDISKDNPTAAYVLELVNRQWGARPVVLGLTDGTSYEVLAGLSANETIVVGIQTNPTTPSGLPFRPGGGGAAGSGG